MKIDQLEAYKTNLTQTFSTEKICTREQHKLQYTPENLKIVGFDLRDAGILFLTYK